MEDKLEKALKELLVSHNTVILPGFGAFVATDIPAMVDSQNNVIYPPRRKVNYNPDVTNDDGVFTSYYARQERISKDTAAEHVAQFIEEVNHKLHRGNPWVVEDLGKFIIDGLEHLNFFPDPDQNFVPQSYGLPEVELLTGAKPEYPEIEAVEALVSAAPKKGKKEEKKKKTREKVEGEPRKRSKAWIVILIFVLLAGGAFGFLTLTEQGKHIASDLKHKIQELMGGKHEEPKKEVKAAEAPKDLTEEVAPVDTAIAATPTTDPAYQPREEKKAFEQPDRVDIEPTKMDKFVKGAKNSEEPAPAPAKPKVEPKKVEPKNTAAPTKAAPKPEVKKTEKAPAPAKPVVKKEEEDLPPIKTVPLSGKAMDDIAGIPSYLKPVKSTESIYARYQIVANEYKSIDDAVATSDRYNRAGFNSAVIQFKDGRFGVCLARSADKAKADQYMKQIGNQVPVKLKEYVR